MRMLQAAEFRRRFMFLVLLTWTVPPVFGLSFIMFIGILTFRQVQKIMLTPIEPVYIFGWLLIALWYFPRYLKPVTEWLDSRSPDLVLAALGRMRGFSLRFWTIFLVYLLLAPSSVIISAELFTDYVAQPVDWFRIHLVALIVSIIVGLPIFFAILDLFGRALGDIPFERPHVTLKVKVFLIGALVPLLIDTMLVQYYWTRTGFFSVETFFVWLFLELLAVAGSLMFVRSFGQSLAPLQGMVENPDMNSRGAAELMAMSTDELGVLATRYRRLLHDLHVHNEILELNNRLLRSAGEVSALPQLLDRVVGLCREAVGDDRAFLVLHDEDTGELVGVAQTGARYNEEGHFRLSLEDNCIVVWVYRHVETAAIEDTGSDPRVSPSMRERFQLRSVLAAPLIQEDRCIGVLLTISSGRLHHYTERDKALIEGLAQEAALAINTVRLNLRRREAEEELQRHQQQLERLVAERTAELSAVNEELEAFSYSVSHDLRGPLRAIDGFSQLLIDDFGDRVDDAGREYLDRVRNAAQRMGELIDDLLDLSRVSRADINSEPVDLSVLAREIVADLRAGEPQRNVEVEVQAAMRVTGDKLLLRLALENLIGNAWKYTSGGRRARIEVGMEERENGVVFFVQDNGVGFDMKYADKLFQPFQRLHGTHEFPGTGIGLATVQRIIQRHGGRLWANAAPGQGARFCFTLPPETGRP